jgi:hypothetical protein
MKLHDQCGARSLVAVSLLAVLSFLVGSCGSGGSAHSTSVVPTPNSVFPHSNHVFIVMEENRGFSQIFPTGLASDCSSSGMPYLCGLANKNGMALNFYSNGHGSLLPYLFNTSGSSWTNSPSNCNGARCAAPGAITGDNLVRALSNSGLTWRGYFEDMPSQGYMQGNTAAYVDRHNPFKWYSDVASSTAQQNNMYPFPQFAADLNADTFQNFSYIVPNLHHDAHGMGTESSNVLLADADSWLQTNISPLLSTPAFQAGGDGVLIITFDESELQGVRDDSCSSTQAKGCGGHVAFVMISPMVVAGSTASSTYHFQDMLHTIIHLLGMSDYMNEASGATDIQLM